MCAQEKVGQDWFLKAKLFLVLDKEAALPRTLEEVTELAITGGVQAVVLRMIDAQIRDILDQGRKVGALCKKGGVPFILSHNPRLSQILHPDGVHLGKRDLPIPDVKRLAPRGTVIGYSAHSVDEARRAVELGADYFFLGPIFATPSKLKYGPPLGVGVISEIPKEILPRAVFIGGIDENNVLELKKHGGKRIAVIRAINSAENIIAAVKRLLELIED